MTEIEIQAASRLSEIDLPFKPLCWGFQHMGKC